MVEVKLTEFGAASPMEGLSREDERSLALAARAQKGDYDDGRLFVIYDAHLG
jgi:tRNA threonylcarbamoyladenosine dehydratase